MCKNENQTPQAHQTSAQVLRDQLRHRHSQGRCHNFSRRHIRQRGTQVQDQSGRSVADVLQLGGQEVPHCDEQVCGARDRAARQANVRRHAHTQTVRDSRVLAQATVRALGEVH